MEKEIETILQKNEKVIWEGKQDLNSTIILSLFTSLIIFAVAFFFVYPMMSSATVCTVNGVVKPCGNTVLWIFLALVFFALTSPLFAYLYWRVTKYLITNKRLVIKSGLIGADIRTIEYDHIRSAFVNVGIIGKLFGTGSILMDTGRITQGENSTRIDYDRFKNIKDPYEIYKLFQDRLSHRKEGLHSGRSDYESNQKEYKKYVQDTERMKRKA